MEAKWFTNHIDWMKIKHDATPPPFQAGKNIHAASASDIGGSRVLVLANAVRRPSSESPRRVHRRIRARQRCHPDKGGPRRLQIVEPHFGFGACISDARAP